jgi:hypothetical protein
MLFHRQVSSLATVIDRRDVIILVADGNKYLTITAIEERYADISLDIEQPTRAKQPQRQEHVA